MDTEINKVTEELNCPCAVTTHSRKAFFEWLNFQDSCSHVLSLTRKLSEEGNTKYKVESASDCPMLAGQEFLMLSAKAKDELRSSPS